MAKKRKNTRGHYAKREHGVDQRSHSQNDKPLPIAHSGIFSKDSKKKSSSNRDKLILPEYQARLGVLRRELSDIDREIANQEEQGLETSLDLLRRRNEVREKILELRNSTNQQINEPIINDLELKEPITVTEIKSELLLDKQKQQELVLKREAEAKREEERLRQLAKQEASKGVAQPVKFNSKDKSITVVNTSTKSTFVFRNARWGQIGIVQTKSEQPVKVPEFIAFQGDTDNQNKKLDSPFLMKQAVQKAIIASSNETGSLDAETYVADLTDAQLKSIFSGPKGQWTVVKLGAKGEVKVAHNSSLNNAKNDALRAT